MMASRIILLAVLLAAPSAFAETGESRTVWLQANNAFHSGEYQKAAELYQQLVNQGVDSSDIYYNLGTAELRAGRRGAAVLALERALRRNPNDADASFNLAEAQKGNVDKIVGPREDEPFLERVGARVPVTTTGIVFLSSWVLLWAALLARSLLTKGRALVELVAGVTALVAVASGSVLGVAAWQRQSATFSVVVASETSVREGPARNFKAAFDVHEGLRLRVIDREGEFLRVRLPNGAEGWVYEKDAPPI